MNIKRVAPFVVVAGSFFPVGSYSGENGSEPALKRLDSR
jgi:hypothetical protein